MLGRTFRAGSRQREDDQEADRDAGRVGPADSPPSDASGSGATASPSPQPAATGLNIASRDSRKMSRSWLFIAAQRVAASRQGNRSADQITPGSRSHRPNQMKSKPPLPPAGGRLTHVLELIVNHRGPAGGCSRAPLRSPRDARRADRVSQTARRSSRPRSAAARSQ